jgi:hypothetical protein
MTATIGPVQPGSCGRARWRAPQDLLDPLRQIRLGRQRACASKPADRFPCQAGLIRASTQLLGEPVCLLAGQAGHHGGTEHLADRRDPKPWSRSCWWPAVRCPTESTSGRHRRNSRRGGMPSAPVVSEPVLVLTPAKASDMSTLFDQDDRQVPVPAAAKP